MPYCFLQGDFGLRLSIRSSMRAIAVALVVAASASSARSDPASANRTVVEKTHPGPSETVLVSEDPSIAAPLPAAWPGFGGLVAPAAGDPGATAWPRWFDWVYGPHLNRPPAQSIDFAHYGPRTLGEQVWAVWPETLAIFAGMTIKGALTWDWGSSPFHFNSEGWFGKDTNSFGMDKLGHAFTGYIITDLATDRIAYHAPDPNGAQLSAAVIAGAVMTYVEIGDAMSGTHGFSHEDLIADFAGIGFSVLRSTFPGLRETLDFRLEYLPSGNKEGFHPITDYSGQKYILALKLAGFDRFRDSPLRFVELHGGYFARGFTDKEQERGVPVRREPYVGIGLNLSELLFNRPANRDTIYARGARRYLEYFQIPYTYVGTSNDW